MSFSSELKYDLCSKPISESNAEAKLCGMLHFSRKFSSREISVYSEHRFVCQLFIKLIEKLYGNSEEKMVESQYSKGKNTVYRVKIVDSNLIRLLYDRFHVYSPQNYTGDYLAGVFLVCGSITDPNKDYRLEFVISTQESFSFLNEIFESLSIQPSITERQGNLILYFKDSEKIEDLLTIMGAAKSSLMIMNVKIYKDIRNKVNRLTNCETANISKTVSAAATVIEDIKYIIEKKGLEFIPEELRETARIRLENPEISLREMLDLMDGTISRSGINHRLKKLSVIAEQIKNDTGD